MIDFMLNYSYENKAVITIMYQKGVEITQRQIKVLSINEVTVHAYCYKRRANRFFKKEYVLAAMIPELVFKYGTSNHLPI
ncbi:hypothetical protein [Alkaliphilus peptidifermentans]|uniref:WYL domain-containing protein n=1 Tax=Alkaliphilus peptidifermentans DSM 18978 TaxID=1120976 RepID=A0A1G5CT46_9FIRM|nr:hypothetical protein [Alkaliphilus peptidifermentans]SCY05438.1 hypothetical protein SAMN03080606_00755 [Alkaliphilus peptidifermentans DSM 18978]